MENSNNKQTEELWLSIQGASSKTESNISRSISTSDERSLYASFQGHGIKCLSDEGRQIKELRKKLRNMELELEILKKAIAVSSKTDM